MVNPYALQQPPQQQGQQQGMNPMQGLQMYQQFAGGQGGGGLSGLFGGGAEAGAGSLSAAEGTGVASGATGGLSGGTAAAGGGEAAGSALMSNPVGWIAAAALAQNVMHNKGISSWQDAAKGTAGKETGDHFMDQWGVGEDSKIRDVAGLAGWGSGGGMLNPGNIMDKIF